MEDHTISSPFLERGRLKMDRAGEKGVLVFQELFVDTEGHTAISGVSGRVEGGEILGVFGPKGSGKLALLTALSGPLPECRGDVTVCGEPPGVGVVKLVPRTDRLLPTLTVEETMRYACLLGQRATQSDKAREAMVKQVTDSFGLSSFLQALVQFTPPAVRKRVAIARAAVCRPDVLLLDEPLKDTDYESSRDVMTSLAGFTLATNTVVVLTMDGASSAVFRMCSKVLFLSEGKTVYWGVPEDLPNFLRDSGCPCPAHHSPVDHMLDMLSSSTCTSTDGLAIDSCLHDVSTTFNGNDSQNTDDLKIVTESMDGHVRVANGENRFLRLEPKGKSNQYKTGSGKRHSDRNRKQQTSWVTQFLLLTMRNFHCARRRLLSPVGVVQNCYILLLCALVWWQPPRSEDRVMDRSGLFFFTVVQWAFFALLDATLTFPKEVLVVEREQKEGLYSASAYVLAKSLSELPLAVLQPAVYMLVMVFVANLNNSPAAVISFLIVVCVDVYAAQSIGLLVGATLTPPWTLSMVCLGLLTKMLIGGAFNTPPSWLSWGQYASFFFYGLNAMNALEFGANDNIQCLPPGVTRMPDCHTVDPVANQTVTSFPADQALAVLGTAWPPVTYMGVLFGVVIVTRVLWYVALRSKHGE